MMNDLTTGKTSFAARFKKRYSLRLHMTLLLLATVCSGFLATRVMLALHLKNVAVRYPLAVAFAYLVFFVWIKLWLKFVAPSVAARAGEGSSGSVNIFTGSSHSGSSGGSSPSGFRGGGGDFSGAGATGSFEVIAPPVPESVAQAAAASLDAGGGVAETAGEVTKDAAGGLGDAVSSIDDSTGCLIAVALLAVAAVIFGAGLFLVYQAPLILSEAAFQAILAGGLAHGAKRLEQGDWMGSVFKATWKSFVLTLVLTIIAGYLMHHYFPGVTRISELFKHFSGR